MAQDTFISFLLDAGTAAIDKQKHTPIAGANLAGDLTIGYNAAKMGNSLNLVDSILRDIRVQFISRGFR